jgi:hypothetical protein
MVRVFKWAGSSLRHLSQTNVCGSVRLALLAP